MIHDADAAVRTLLRRDAINGADVAIEFDVPTKEWAARRTGPTLNVYLFDIREDVSRRRVGLEPIVDDSGFVTGRRRVPRRYRLTYLITAWTQRPEDEHRLLSAVLQAFLPHEELPRDVLEGVLAEQDGPILSSIGLPPPQERAIGEIWSAIGGELKPSLDLVLNVPFVAGWLDNAGPPVMEEPRFEVSDGVARERVGGRPVLGERQQRRFGPDIRDRDTPSRTGAVQETVYGGRQEKRGRTIRIQTIEPRHD